MKTLKSKIIDILEDHFEDYDEIAMQEKFIKIAVEIEKLIKDNAITDEDIKSWADELRIKNWFDAHIWGGLFRGAKAMRDGEIKHID